MVTSRNRIRNVLSCLIGTASFAVAIGTFGHAAADMNVVGSTHGQNYQGVPDPSGPPPTPAGASYAVPLSLCDADSPTPHRYSSKANLVDLLDSNIVMPVNTSILWVCKVGGTDGFKFRYTGGFSARAYAAIKAPLNDTGSRFTSVVDAAGSCTSVNGGAAVIDPGTGLPYISHKDCTSLELVNANFATSDTKGTAFAANMCDQTGACAAPILETNVQSFPITATPFVIIVGNGVQKCSTDPGHLNAAGGKISLTRSQVEAIFSGQVTNWNQLGICVFPAATVDGNGFPQLDPINTPFNAGVDQNIMTCSRPITAGTRIIFNATQMINAPEISQGSVGGGAPYQAFTSAGGVYNWLAPTVSDGLVCVQGRLTPTLSPPNRNAIAYNRADEAANVVDFGGGNVGRMVGGYPVALDAELPSNYVKPVNIIHPTSDERRISQEDFRCGRYTFWADWVGIHRTSPLDVNQDLWKRYVSAIATNLGDTPSGFFWAKNLKFPGAPPVINSEMFVSKAGTKGPTQWNIGFPQDCR